MFLCGFLFFIVLQRDESAAETVGERCFTVESAIGRCIDIRQCPRLLKFLEGPRPLPTASVDYLRKAQCGFEGRNPLVCCANEQPTTTTQKYTRPRPTTERVTTDEPGESPVDVSRHPNLRLLPKFCGALSENKITGGNISELFEFPWMALLGYTSYDSDDIQYRCGGSLINENYVLTAAHCVTFLSNLELVVVRLGEYDLRTPHDCQPELGCAPPTLNLQIDRIISHPDYTKDELTNDIALIRVETPAKYSKSVRPICLPVGLKEQSKTLVNEKATVSGWGTTENGSSSDILLKIDLPVVPRKECAEVYRRAVPVTDFQMCAGGLSGKDSCGGDSGGPLQFVGEPLHGGLSFIQYGIVSYGPRQCGTHGRPGVYTRVGFYMDWLLNNMRP